MSRNDDQSRYGSQQGHRGDDDRSRQGGQGYESQGQSYQGSSFGSGFISFLAFFY